MYVYVAVAVSLVCFILYALDRKSKEEPIEWASAFKMSILGGLLGGGISFASSAPDVLATAIKEMTPEVPPIQDMFIGIPTF